MLSEEERKEMLEKVEHCIKNFNGKVEDCLAVGDMYIEYLKQDEMINLMSLAILNYDDQLVINKYKDIKQVKETFKELVEEKTYNEEHLRKLVEDERD